MQNDKLLQCPFCGGEVKLDEDDFYMFCCDTCGAGVTFAKELPDGTAEDCDKKESIEKWNTRKPMKRIVEWLQSQYRKVTSDEDLEWNRAIDRCANVVRKGGVEDAE